MLIGDGIVSFEPDRWAMYDSDGRNDMGAISHRAGTNGEVYGLPAQGGIFNLLPFEFINQDRIHLIGVVHARPRQGRRTCDGPGGCASGFRPRHTRHGLAGERPRHLRCAGCGFSGSCRVCTRCEFETERFRGRMGYDCSRWRGRRGRLV